MYKKLLRESMVLSSQGVRSLPRSLSPWGGDRVELPNFLRILKGTKTIRSLPVTLTELQVPITLR